MWYKCLNKNCGFVFHRTGECDKCPDCGKEYLRIAKESEIEQVYLKCDDSLPDKK